MLLPVASDPLNLIVTQLHPQGNFLKVRIHWIAFEFIRNIDVQCLRVDSQQSSIKQSMDILSMHQTARI